jgi:glycosyltransferase involved in cell wall biosynthesis
METTTRLRVVFLDIFTNGGGIPVVAGRLIYGMCSRASDVEVTLIVPFSNTLALLQIERPARLRLIELPVDERIRYISRFRPLLKAFLWGKLCFYGIRLGFALRKHNIDVIVFNLPKSGVVAWLSSIICRARLLFYCHGVQFIDDMGMIYRFLLSRSYQVVAVSTGTKQQLVRIGINEERIEVIYNSTDTSFKFIDREEARMALGLEQKALIIGYVGNIIQRKGLDILVKAFAELIPAPNNETVLLAIVGADTREQDGAFIESVRLEINKNELNELVIFLGYRPDVARLMRAFDIFVVPSRMESFGVAIIEAMAAGIPVIASRTGSIPEVIENNRNGLLFEALDHRELADKIRILLSDKDLVDSIVMAALRDVRTNFSMEEQTNHFYRWLARKFMSLGTPSNRTSPSGSLLKK